MATKSKARKVEPETLKLERQYLLSEARRIGDECHEAHRGAMIDRDDVDRILCFGNDGATSERSRTAVATARTILERAGYVLSEVVLDDIVYDCDESENRKQVGESRLLEDMHSGPGYTWVYLVTPPEAVDIEDAWDVCEEAIWHGWAVAIGDEPTPGYGGLQRAIAQRYCF